MNPAPILVFTYNRLLHTKNTVEALKKNSLSQQSHLFIFSDACRTEKDMSKVQGVRNYLKTITGFKNITIIEREYNYGLGNNIIDGVTKIVNEYGCVIVMEDDLLSSPYFLEFMNKGLEIYEHNENVISIHGYLYPIKKPLPETFFMRNADCLGWATWKRGWDLFEPDGNILLAKLNERSEQNIFDFNNSYPFTNMLKDFVDGKNNSWAVRWYASAFLNNKLTLYPGRSLIFHAGGDGTGVNTGFDNHLDVSLSKTPIQINPIPVENNTQAYDAFAEFYSSMVRPSVLYRVRRKFKKMFH